MHSTRRKAEDDNWDEEKVYIELDATQFTGREGVKGLESSLFKADATWWRRAGLANSAQLSFESFNE